MKHSAVQVEGISKRYALGAIGTGSVREDLNRLYARIRGRGEQSAAHASGGAPARTEHWALRDVSFEVAHGEVLGIIGRNGAGKSTLLKILSRITAPTNGTAVLHGRVGCLLEVGTGFHPELTGRENVFLNGAILGMKRVEILKKLDAIVDFAEIEEYIDTPVKRYSSGMTVRLAFSVAAHLEPEILIIDEVLAVGDFSFQAKCLGRLGEAATGGRTVLFVSHNLSAVQSIAKRCIEIQDGRVVFDGATPAALEHYSMGNAGETEGCYKAREMDRPVSGLSREIELSEIRLVAVEHRDGGVVIRLAVKAVRRSATRSWKYAVSITRSDHVLVGALFSEQVTVDRTEAEAEMVVTTPLLRIGTGSYSLSVAVGAGDAVASYRMFDAVADVLHFQVETREASGGQMLGWNPGWGPCDFGMLELCKTY